MDNLSKGMKTVVLEEDFDYGSAPGTRLAGKVPPTTFENMDEPIQKVHKWYALLGTPTRDEMKAKIAKNPQYYGVTPDMVDLLPWNGGAQSKWSYEQKHTNFENKEYDQKGMEDRLQKKQEDAERSRKLAEKERKLEELRRKEEEARRRKEEEERRRKEEEERKRREEAERKRREKEAAERKRREEEEAARRNKGGGGGDDDDEEAERLRKLQALIDSRLGKRNKFSNEDEQKRKQFLRETRLLMAYRWWYRFSTPNKKDMTRKVNVGDMKEADIYPEDVDLLPWLHGGFTVDVQQMLSWISSLDPKVTETVEMLM